MQLLVIRDEDVSEVHLRLIEMKAVTYCSGKGAAFQVGVK